MGLLIVHGVDFTYKIEPDIIVVRDCNDNMIATAEKYESKEYWHINFNGGIAAKQQIHVNEFPEIHKLARYMAAMTF